jgi:HEAT repeat protein
MPTTSRIWVCAVLLVGVCLSPCQAREANSQTLKAVIDTPMYQDPVIPVSRTELFYTDRAKGLWEKAFQQPNLDLKRQVANAVVLAKRRGVKGIESLVPALRTAFDPEEQVPVVRLAIARALIELDVRAAAPSLWKQAQAGSGDLRDLVEPALARWGHRPANAVWLERLRDPNTRQRDLVLAIHCLETVREERAADRLRELVVAERTPPPVRLQAARALGSLRTSGLEKDAQALAGDTSARGVTGRLAAAALLRKHRGKVAVEFLTRLALDREPAVTAAAVAPLVEFDPKLAQGALDHLLASPDASVRLLGVEVLFRVPSEKHAALLGERLDDLHPDVRVKARHSLQKLAARKDLQKPVIEAGMTRLGRASWRGQEQAAVLLAQLDHKEAAGRLVELLESPRPETFIAAAWGLRKLAVADTLPDALKYVEAERSRQSAKQNLPGRQGNMTPWLEHQFSQLNQFFGQQKYAAADEVLRGFIPHQPTGVNYEARAAAIWALGKIHEGKSVPSLVDVLAKRLNDVATMPPEDPRVRRMSAIALGRLRSKDAKGAKDADFALQVLQGFAPGETLSAEPVFNACAWALERITGEKMPKAVTIRREVIDWFLSPRE